MPKSGILNAKKWCLKCQKWRLTFMKWTPGLRYIITNKLQLDKPLLQNNVGKKSVNDADRDRVTTILHCESLYWLNYWHNL